MRLTRLVPLYASLVLALAAMGAVNQARFNQQAALIHEKGSLFEQIAQLRSEAAEVRGPLAVGTWAREHGMVPTPEVDNVRHVAYLAPAAGPATLTGLEVRTVWR